MMENENKDKEDKELSIDTLYDRKKKIISGEKAPVIKKSKNEQVGCLQMIYGFFGGCGCLVLLLGFGGPAPLMPFFFPEWFTTSREHQEQGGRFTMKGGTNYSFHNMFMHQVCEFDISKDDFLVGKPEAIPIESLPTLPPFGQRGREPRVNYQREIPISNIRYCYVKPEHEKCSPWSPKCNVDPTGKTDDSCFHFVSKGYYYEYRGRNGGGIRVLYDTENGRCYIHANHH
jgi:hypothetical protein